MPRPAQYLPTTENRPPCGRLLVQRSRYAPRAGRLAQLGERLPYKQEVGGSIPSPPTRTSPRSASATAIAVSPPVASARRGFAWESPGSRSSEPNEGCGTPRPVRPGPSRKKVRPHGPNGLPPTGVTSTSQKLRPARRNLHKADLVCLVPHSLLATADGG
jgi:hypothetical protein